MQFVCVRSLPWIGVILGEYSRKFHFIAIILAMLLLLLLSARIANEYAIYYVLSHRNGQTTINNINFPRSNNKQFGPLLEPSELVI